jgi:hypothetical protein
MGLFIRFGRSGRTLLLPIPRSFSGGQRALFRDRGLAGTSSAWWIGSAGKAIPPEEVEMISKVNYAAM